MKNNQHIRQAQYKQGFANTILPIVILLLVGVGGYFALKAKPKPISELVNEIATVDTSNWGTYMNDKYGFEFKYPKNHFIKSDKNIISIGNDDYDKLYIVNLINNLSNISPDKYVEELRQKGAEEHYAPIVSSSKKISVDSVDGIDAILVAPMGVPERNIFLPLKNKLLNFSYFLGEGANYVLDMYFKGDQDKFGEYLKNGNAILSTFKFTDIMPLIPPVSMTNWKTYTNTKYSFQLKYPKDWSVVSDHILPLALVSKCANMKIETDTGCAALIFSGSYDGKFTFFGSGTGEPTTVAISEARGKKLGDTEYKVIHNEFEGVGDNDYFVKIGENKYLGFAYSQRYDGNREKNEATALQILGTLKFTK